MRLLCVAAGGYKQPQQFLALAYLLAQGTYFDLVINVDGFNELALPAFDNRPRGVAPIYPRAWNWRVGSLQDAGALKLLAQLTSVDRERREWAARFVDWGLYRSRLLALVWWGRDRLLGAQRSRIAGELEQHRVEQRRSYTMTGPVNILRR